MEKRLSGKKKSENDGLFKTITGIPKKYIWKAIATKEQQEWYQKLSTKNNEFYNGLQETVHYQYDDGSFIWYNCDINTFKSNIFSLASLSANEWFLPNAHDAQDVHDVWHCDGGASTIFPSNHLKGSRKHVIENNKKVRKTIILNVEIDYYLSQTSGFWHCVSPGEFENGYSSCTALIFRSTVLAKRLSGGFENPTTKLRSGGRHICKTKKIFENLRVEDYMTRF